LAQGAGGNGDRFVGLEEADFLFELGQKGEGASAGGGLESAGKCDTLPEAGGVGFFVVDAEGGAGLFGQKKFKGVGAEVEHRTAKRGIGHTLVKAVIFTDGKAFAESRRTGWE
jgi:hypothetical protein